jgi:hypothetical protein
MITGIAVVFRLERVKTPPIDPDLALSSGRSFLPIVISRDLVGERR